MNPSKSVEGIPRKEKRTRYVGRRAKRRVMPSLGFLKERKKKAEKRIMRSDAKIIELFYSTNPVFGRKSFKSDFGDGPPSEARTAM